MLPGTNGLPDPNNRVRRSSAGAAGPVELQIGPGGDLYYVDIEGGTIRRIRSLDHATSAPIAVATATPTTGGAPLTVTFDGPTSSDPDGQAARRYAWDLDADGAFDDSTSSSPSLHLHRRRARYTARLRVTEPAA